MTPTFLITTIPGFFLAKLLSGKGAGQPAKFGSLRFRIKTYTIHVHHWFWALGLIGMLHLIQLNYSFVYGFLSGVAAQGLTYSDFYKLIYKNPPDSN